MDDKKGKPSKAEAYYAGKGFYIVLLLCVAVIGVSAWSMLSGGERAETALPVSNLGEPEPTAAVVATEPPTVLRERATEPTATPEPTAETVVLEEPEAEPVQAETPAEEPVPAEAPAQSVPAAVEPSTDYFIWPVAGTVETQYSMAALIYDRTMQDWRTHDGVDIAAELGTQVRAAANGKVESVYSDDRYGTTVVIAHSGGLQSIYANLAGTPAVTEGQQVSVGQVVGAIGDTALCEIGQVSHLHFAMSQDGLSVDPNEYLP